MTAWPILGMEGVSKRFGAVRAVDALDLRIGVHESVALVGRSGSGKTTVARLIVGLEHPDAGVIRLLGEDLATLRQDRRRAVLTRVGLISQDPYAALSPSARIADIVAEPLLIARVRAREARGRAAAALAEVGLGDQRYGVRTTDQLSGGERQRVGLARAIAPEPVLLIADEPTSMLDTTRQRELLELLAAVRATRPMALLFITHDLALAAETCERIAVMDAGRVVEHGRTSDVLRSPRTPASLALVGAGRIRSAAMAAVAGSLWAAAHDPHRRR